jgi:DNA-binding NarL/FixJ family response regulator
LFLKRQLLSRENSVKETSVVSVLIVDDFEQWRGVVRAVLQDGLQLQLTEEAGDGPEAVQKAQELQPNLVVLDIGLPRLNGIEVARQIKSVSPKSEIVFLSENRSAEVADAALDTGARAFVVKSACRRELIPAVEAALSNRRFLARLSPSLIHTKIA